MGKIRVYADTSVFGGGAAATVAGANLLVSWNFKHIVNYDRIHKYNAINQLNSYLQIEIRSPMEMGYGNEDQDL